MYDFDLIFVLNLTEVPQSKLDVKAKRTERLRYGNVSQI